MAEFDRNSPFEQVGRCTVCLATRHLEREVCARCASQVSPRVAKLVHQARRNPHLARLCAERLTGAARDEFLALLGNMSGLVGPGVSKCTTKQVGLRPVKFPVLRAAGEG